MRPAPVIGRVSKAVGENHLDSRKAEEARYLRLGETPALAAPRWEVGMDILAVFLPAAGLETAGERSVLRGGWDATLRRRIDDRSLALYLGAEASFYDWSSTAPLPGGPTDSFNDLYETRLGALLEFAEDQQLSWFSGMEITVAGEDSASIGEALSIGVATGVDVRANPDLTLSFGLAALTRLEDTTWVLPYFGFDWQLTDRLRFATDRAGLLFESRFTDAWTATVTTKYELRQFRLNSDNAISRGVYQDDQITLTGTIERRLGESATLSLTGGAVLWQESRYLDGGGTKLGEVETEPGLYGAISLRFGSY